MGREILFKAKRVDNGEWVEGNLLCSSDAEEDFKALIIPCFDAYMYTRDYQADLGVENWYKVDPNTICQYTGLTDKNGKKIWENDICSTDIKRPYAIVEFRNGCFMYNLNDGGEDYYDIMLPVEPLVFSDKYTEVICNIFDNPELCEEKTWED